MHVRSDRQIHRPYGLDGGRRGRARRRTLIFRAGGELERMPPMFGAVLQPGDVMHHRMAGGGGHGDPLERDPHAVARDVLDDKVSVAAAREPTASSSATTASSTSRRPRRCGGASVR